VWTGGLGISALGTIPPNNTMVETGRKFHVQCMPHDYWMTHGNYWYIYFTVTSIICEVHAGSRKGDRGPSNCSEKYDLSRFSAYRVDYVLMLDVNNTITTDAGLYVCAQPPFHNIMGHLGLIAVVGIVCKLS